MLARYQGDIHAITGHVVQPIDEFNRPAKADYLAQLCIPAVRRKRRESSSRFGGAGCPTAPSYPRWRRDYLAASLWRRAGLRIGETLMLDVREPAVRPR